MGARADFYVGRGKDAEWLGSISLDGYPDGIDTALLKSTTLQQYKARLRSFLSKRNDVTHPKDGWPWPWDDSNTTDCAYAFDKGRVHISWFGSPWQLATSKRYPKEGEGQEFPNMKAVQRVAKRR